MTTTRKLLLVFDFDWSLIDENSDYYIYEKLAPDLLERMQHRSKTENIGFTRLVDETLVELQAKGINLDKHLKPCLSSIPFHPKMLELLSFCRDQIKAFGRDRLDLLILSDANTYFIETILKAYGYWDLFEGQVITNPAYIDEKGLLRVKPYTDDGVSHGCDIPCAVNLCKGRELRGFLDKFPSSNIIYVGDSNNDFCPIWRCLTDGERHWALARKNRSLEKLLLTGTAGYDAEYKTIRANGRKVGGRVLVWEDGSDVYRIVQEHWKQHILPFL